MADTWLTPGGDLAAVVRACRVPASDEAKPTVIADLELAVAVAVDWAEVRCGTITAPAPAWATAGALLVAALYYRTSLGETRVDTSHGSGDGYLVPKAALDALEGHESAPLGFS